MNTEAVTASQDLFQELEKVSKFRSKFGELPYRKVGELFDDITALAESLPDIDEPQDQDELYTSELKRRLQGDANMLRLQLGSQRIDFDTVVDLYAIPREDVDGLRGWLETNREETLETIDRLFDTRDVGDYELSLPTDIPGVRRQAEEFAAVHIHKYHAKLGKLLGKLTSVGEFLRDIEAVATSQGRSYFHPLTKRLALGIPAICVTSGDGSLQIRERDLIELWGHEGMGHALNKIMTDGAELPYFLTRDTPLVVGTMESVAQFYQRQIFKDLRDSPETQKELGIAHHFDDIVQDANDTELLSEYRSKLFRYAITVLADKSLGDPEAPDTLKKKIEKLEPLALHPSWALGFVESQRRSFDSEGNLSPQLVSELRYAARPVERAFVEFAKQGIAYEGEGRSKIDSTLLTGFWTPIGYLHNARLSAQEKQV